MTHITAKPQEMAQVSTFEAALSDMANEHRRLRELLYQLRVTVGVGEGALLAVGLIYAEKHGLNPYAVERTAASVAKYRQRWRFYDISVDDASCIDGLSWLIEAVSGVDSNEAISLALLVAWHELVEPTVNADKARHQQDAREQFSARCVWWEGQYATWRKVMCAGTNAEGCDGNG